MLVGAMAYRLGFVMEQTLGHVTHAQNFAHWVSKDPDVIPTWLPVQFGPRDNWGRAFPGLGDNWTLRSSLKARGLIRDALRSSSLDGLFFHTQVVALFAHRLMGEIPSVVSMDATPLNFDRIGIPYDHVPSALTRVESAKNALNRRTFKKARKLVSWHEWGKHSLVDDYGVEAAKVSVIPPGIDLERWDFPRDGADRPAQPVRLLFVGGDFRRKGGETLLTAFRRHLTPGCELDIVTREQVDTSGLANVRIHHGLGPNAPELMALYARADVFIFPTLADTLPLVNMEAMASGLPVVTTNVGALTEEIEDGVTGFLVPPLDADALGTATRRLVDDAGLRRRMGAAGRRRAVERFNGSLNYPQILTLCKQCVDLA
jgi:glycosyltransferase involved in cell wall biosynthesis